MVRSIKYTLAFFRLIRWKNLVIIASTMYLLRWLVFIPLLRKINFDVQISEPIFLLLVLSTLSIGAAGYVINDYFDRKLDLINRPGKVILGRILTRRAGMFWHIFLTGIGLLLGVFVSYKLGLLKFCIVFFIISGLLWFYSTTYKRQVLTGNLVVAFLVACVPLVVLLFELPLIIKKYHYYMLYEQSHIDLLAAWVVGYSAFAFLLTFIREVVKDLEDFEGDFAYGVNTIPIAWGPDISKKILYAAVGIILIFTAIILFKFRWSLITLIYGLTLVVIPLIWFVLKLAKASKKIDYTRLSLFIKFIMLSGLIYIVVASFWVI